MNYSKIAVVMLAMIAMVFAVAPASAVVSQTGYGNIYYGSADNQQIFNTNTGGIFFTSVGQYANGVISFGNSNVQSVGNINKGAFVTVSQTAVGGISNGNNNNQNVGNSNTANVPVLHSPQMVRFHTVVQTIRLLTISTPPVSPGFHRAHLDLFPVATTTTRPS